jgi:hypothetical protein
MADKIQIYYFSHQDLIMVPYKKFEICVAISKNDILLIQDFSCPEQTLIIYCVLGYNILFMLFWDAIYYFLHLGTQFIIYCVLGYNKLSLYFVLGYCLLFFESWVTIYYLLHPGLQKTVYCGFAAAN